MSACVERCKGTAHLADRPVERDNKGISMMRTAVAVLALGLCGIAHGGPETKVASLSSRYPSGEMEITWATVLTGGCTTSNFALTNATAANHQALIASLLAALSLGATVEVTFGGGCGTGNTNWIQTIRVIAP